LSQEKGKGIGKILDWWGRLSMAEVRDSPSDVSGDRDAFLFSTRSQGGERERVREREREE
jgi:hypothetical protein